MRERKWEHCLTDKDRMYLNHFKKHIGNLLRQKRDEKNYSQAAVAQDTSISKSAISEAENGTKFNIAIIGALAAYYNISLEQLFNLSVVAAQNNTGAIAKAE